MPFGGQENRKKNMTTINELMSKFASDTSTEENFASPGDEVVPDFNSVNDGQLKTASEGDKEMQSLTDIYMAIADNDHEKLAAQAAFVPAEEEYETDFAKIAGDLASAEAHDLIEEDNGDEIVKVAAEYDSAGRIMARGFYDEFMKLSGAMDTDVTSNQMTESPSAASTPSMGDRGLPTVPTNFAGNEAHDGQIETAGQAGKQVYVDVLKPNKSISAGQGTGDDPEAAAISLGGGSPAGFATVKDLTA